VGTVQIS